MAATHLFGFSAGKVIELVAIASLPSLSVDPDTITNAMLVDMAQATIKGRASGAGTGDPTDLTATQVRTILNVADGATANSSDATLLARANHTGTQLASTISDFEEAVEDVMGVAIVAGTNMTVTYNDGAGTITLDSAAGVPGADSVTNTILANMAESTIKGRAAGAGTGDPTDLTATQVRTLINVADGATANSSDATLLARANHTGTQLASTISDFDEAVDDRVGTLLVAGTNILLTYNDGAGTLTIDGTVTVGADSIDNSELTNMAESTLKGRSAGSGTGDPEDLTAAQARTLLNVADGATANSSDATLLARANHTGTQTASTISDFNEAVDDRVGALVVAGTNVTAVYDDGLGTLTISAATGAPTANSVTNVHLADMATQTIKGRNTAGTGDPEDLSAATVRTILNVANGATANSSDATLLARANHTGTQLASTISDLSEAVDDRVAALIVAGTGITATYNDGAGTLTLDASVAASGNFTPVGTGAVVRTQDVKMREVEISVKDYGAVSDGTGNNVTAFANAIAAAVAGNKRLRVPSGTYRFNSTLNIDQNVHIFGDDRATTILRFHNTTGHGVNFSGVAGSPNLVPTELTDVTIEQASGVNQTDGSHGLRIGCKAHMRNVFVDSFTNDSFYLDQQTPGDNTTSPFFSIFHNCQSVDTGRDGWVIRAGANANLFFNCQSVRAGRYGMHHYTDGFGTYANLWIGGQCSYSAQYNFYHESGTDCLYDHIYAEGGGRSGGVGYVNTQFDYFFSQNSDRCRVYVGAGGPVTRIRAPARGSLESCGVWIGGQRVYGNTASTPEANEGVLYNIPTRASAVATNNTANASDLATAIALANSLKTTVNNLLTQLRAGRMIEP